MSIPEQFTLVALSANVITNIATDILEYRLKNLENSSLVGQILKRLGLVEQNFEERLQGILSKTLTHFFELYPQYSISGVISFLRDPVTAKMICGFILDRQIINQEELNLALATHLVSKPITNVLIKQRGLDSEKIIGGFIECYRRTLNEQLNIPEISVLLSVLEQKNIIIEEIKSSEEKLQSTVRQIGTKIQIQQSSLIDIQNSLQTIIQLITNQENALRQTNDLTALSFHYGKTLPATGNIDISHIQIDMPDLEKIKFDLYTLACRELSNRLIDLQIATISDSWLSVSICIDRFDRILHEFLSLPIANSKEEASRQINNLIRAEVEILHDYNKLVGEIFDDLGKAIASKASSWNSMAEIEQLHIQSRNLAKQFYATSNWTETQTRLSRKCNIVIQYDSKNSFGNNQESTFFHFAPVSYYHNYIDKGTKRRKNTLVFRFNFGHNFRLFLSYPFLLLHEYISHVFVSDDVNERFNEGWMVYAESLFLVRLLGETEQVNIFYEYLYPMLHPLSRRSYDFARSFEAWLGKDLENRFMQITYELAAFKPRKKENIFFPSQFINSLEKLFLTDRKYLREILNASTNSREIMAASVVNSLT